MDQSSYIDAAKKKLGIDSDNALSIEMGLTRSAISRYRTHKSYFDEYACFKLAEILELDARIIMSEMRLIKEKDPEKSDFWKEQLKKYTTLSKDIEDTDSSFNYRLC